MKPPMFRYSIRDLLWLALVVALALGWTLDRKRLTNSLRSCRYRAQQVTSYLERIEDLQVQWRGDEMQINRESPDFLPTKQK